MARLDDLRKATDNDPLLDKLLEQMVHQEELLDDLLKYPKYRTDKNHPGVIKITDASKLYKETYTMYLNTVRVIERATMTDETEADSPLRAWLNANKE